MLASGDGREGEGPGGCSGGPTGESGDVGRDGGRASRGQMCPHRGVLPRSPENPRGWQGHCPAASWAASHLRVSSALWAAGGLFREQGAEAPALRWEAPPDPWDGQAVLAHSFIHSSTLSLLHRLCGDPQAWAPGEGWG